MTAEVHVVLVNYGESSDTIDCLGSLQRMAYPATRVAVVDNASSEESRRALSSFPGVEVLPSAENLGFAGGCNLGIRHALAAGADYIWLLNNDTTVRPDALDRLVQAAQEFPHLDFVGSWIELAERPGTLWFGGGRYRRGSGLIEHIDFGSDVHSHPLHGQLRETDWVTGCSVLVTPRTITRHGYLDENLFLYREDVAWQLGGSDGRPRAALVCEPLVRHKVGATTGTSEGRLGVAFMSRNYLLLALRHAGIAFPVWLARWVRTSVLAYARRRDWASLHAALLGARHLRTPGAQVAALVTQGDR